MPFTSLHTLADRPRQACPKPRTRLESIVRAKALSATAEQNFRMAVWKRDRYRCRCCHRKVFRSLARVLERGEVHHLHGRLGALRYEVRAAILVCAECHGFLTGSVNQPRWRVVATKRFYLPDHGKFSDATSPLRFIRS